MIFKSKMSKGDREFWRSLASHLTEDALHTAQSESKKPNPCKETMAACIVTSKLAKAISSAVLDTL